MIVTFVSASSGKSIDRVNAILDAFATRTSERTWTSKFTKDGIMEVRKALSAIMSKTLSVSCHVNAGNDGMRLLWIAGNRDCFGADGSFCVGFRKKPSPAPSLSEKMLMKMVSNAGMTHDIGKASDGFQNKLKSRKRDLSGDCVRHEWISMHVLSGMKDGLLFDDVWKRLVDMPSDISNNLVFGEGGLKSTSSVTEFLVGSHHKLPRFNPEKNKGYFLGGARACSHVRETSVLGSWMGKPKLKKPLKTKFESVAHDGQIEAMSEQILSGKSLPEERPMFFRGCANIARPALMFADHYVSSMKVENADVKGLAANTCAPGKLNQNLEFHLSKISVIASRIMKDILRMKLPKLSDRVVKNIMARSKDERFVWQDEASDFLSVNSDGIPSFVLNVAGTGSGKTKMNMKALCSLRQGRDVRITSAMNLRTLTLQTNAAYESMFDMKEELSCVLGDSLAKKMFAYDENVSKGNVQDCDEEKVSLLREQNGQEKLQVHEIDESGKDGDIGVDVHGGFEDFGDIEYEWLSSLLENRPEIRNLLLTPVSVSTIDYVIDAGDLSKSSRYLMSSLRVLTSDLILDEIDGYDPKATIAVSRLVFAAGLWGRNVVASSATLSCPVAKNIVSCFLFGVRLRELVFGLEKTGANVFMIDNVLPPEVKRVGCHATANSLKDVVDLVEGCYSARMKALSKKSATMKFRVGKLVETGQGKSEWKESIRNALGDFAGRHNFSFRDKKVSFGLVRVANIRTAIELASFLAESGIPGWRLNVCCYHSSILRMHRFHIERNLDAMLDRRGNWLERLSSNEVFLDSIETDCGNVLNLVVATPVEEVGRDHDFDFGIIEVSSAQSVVQTAGRINRHRMSEVNSPNVGVLRFNYRRVSGGDVERLCFVNPGYEMMVTDEISEKSVSTHETPEWGDVGSLFAWKSGELNINASLRFDAALHPMSKGDDMGIERIVGPVMRDFLSMKKKDSGDRMIWACANFYEKYRLREASRKNVYRLVSTDRGVGLERMNVSSVNGVRNVEWFPEPDMMDSSEDCSERAWLSPSDEELIEMSSGLGEEALYVEVLCYGEKDMVRRNRSFGFYRKQKRLH